MNDSPGFNSPPVFRPERPAILQPRATPWVGCCKRYQALKGRHKRAILWFPADFGGIRTKSGLVGMEDVRPHLNPLPRGEDFPVSHRRPVEVQRIYPPLVLPRTQEPLPPLPGGEGRGEGGRSRHDCLWRPLADPAENSGEPNLFRPFRALIGWGTLFPGRCPGLKYGRAFSAETATGRSS
jgi:hypothetical protein